MEAITIKIGRIAEDKVAKKVNADLDYLDRRREKINSLRNSRGQISFVAEDIFADLIAKFQ